VSVGDVRYYAVDHTPTYLWNSASWEISKALLPYLRTLMSGPSAWEQNETVRRAIEIREGVILNPHILSFQKRDVDYPHKIR
jgi:alanine dehydrogenase